MTDRITALYAELEKLASEEARWDIENRGGYKSLREAYAVLVEEIGEATADIRRCYRELNVLKKRAEKVCRIYEKSKKGRTGLWESTKEQAAANARDHARAVLETALRAAAELVQTAAAAKKMLSLIQASPTTQTKGESKCLRKN